MKEVIGISCGKLHKKPVSGGGCAAGATRSCESEKLFAKGLEEIILGGAGFRAFVLHGLASGSD